MTIALFLLGTAFGLILAALFPRRLPDVFAVVLILLIGAAIWVSIHR